MVQSNTDYVIASIRVGNALEPEALDIEIPLKVGGLRQTVADTVGIGGLMKGLRTIPAMLNIARDMEKYCPDAILLNYTNPMASIMWAILASTRVAGVGLCHSVQRTSHQLSIWAWNYEQMRYQVAGINHMAWFLDLSLNGVDLYPRLENCLEEPETVKKDPVRFEIFKQFGRFVTESSRHMAEYVPYFMRSDVEVERLDIPVSWLEKVEKFRQARAIRNRKMTTDPSIEIRRSNEYAARIIHAIETDTPAYIYGNVLNTGLVSNLPNGCCVEVPCLVNRAGLQPCYIGDLPPQCAALCRTNVNTQELTVRAILEKNRDYIYHAAMLDPNTSAQMTLPQIRTTMDQLLDAQKHLIEV